MKVTGKITFAASGLVIAGLVALAVPAFVSIGQATHSAAQAANDLAEPVETPAESNAEPTAEPTAKAAADRGKSPKTRAANAIGCDDFASVGSYSGAEQPSPRPDRGPSDYAAGTVTFGSDGGVETFTVAPGDSGMSIGERFCVDYVTLLVANDKWPPAQTIQPGDILLINP